MPDNVYGLSLTSNTMRTPELCARCFSSVCSTCPPTQCPGCHPALRQVQQWLLRPSDVVGVADAAEVNTALSGPARTPSLWHTMAAMRAEQWKTQWGLQDPTDFAFAFSTYDSAVAHGGHHVADAWLQARSQCMEDDLIPQVQHPSA